MEPTEPDVIDLRDYLHVLTRQWKPILGTTLVVVAVALAVSFWQAPTYEATTEVRIEEVRSGPETVLSAEVDEAEQRVITSSSNIIDRVIADLERNADPGELSMGELQDIVDDFEEIVDVRLFGGRIVTITASSDDPSFAAELTNSVASSYLDHRRSRASEEITVVLVDLTERAQQLREQIDAIESQFGPFIESAATLPPGDQLLVNWGDALTQQLTQVEAELSARAMSDEPIQVGEILVRAEPADDPMSPRPLRTAVLALVLGLMLGVGAAFLRDHVDDVIHSEDDVWRASNEPIVGRISMWDDPGADQKLVTLEDPLTPNSEQFQAVAAKIRFALLAQSGRSDKRSRDAAHPAGRSIAITSSTKGAGTTTVAGNIAVAVAATGRQVILVDADLRTPAMERRFGLQGGVGLTEALGNAADSTDEHELAGYLVDVGVPHLRLLPAGSPPANPVGLLASDRMASVRESLADMADLIIYDTPAVLPVADALDVAHHADLTFLVTRVEHCRQADLVHALERLESVGADVGGIVLNDVR